MNCEEIVSMMSMSYTINGPSLSCAEAAGAMAGVLSRVHQQLSQEDFHLLVVLGSVMFREGLKEFDSAKQARQAIYRARQPDNGSMKKE